MITINARNVRDAYAQGMRLLRREGVREESRAGPVLVLPCPVMTVYAHPTERVLVDPLRDQNCFFTCAESLWMLAGRRDADFLNRYIGDFGKRFAEPDGRVHDAYGYRWRAHFGYDQLSCIVKRLRENPGDRQAVLQMWDATPVAAGQHGNSVYSGGANDLRKKDLKTRPCLAGDTIIWSPEGDLPIAEIANKFKTGEVNRWPVYSVKGTKMKLQWATSVWKTGRRKTLRITFDDGSQITCTPDHRFFKYNKGTSIYEIETTELRVGDRVQARVRKWDHKGYEMFGRSVHSQYAELLYGKKKQGQCTHHKDENKKNNRGSNLEYLTESHHNSIHRVGDRNPMRKLSPEKHAIRSKKQSLSLRAYWNGRTTEQRRDHSIKTSQGQTPEGRLRQIASVTGRKHSETSKIKMAEIKKQYWAEQRQINNNHIVVDISDGPIQDVYDFTVPGFHTAIVGTGVVTHNCNTQAYFRVRHCFVGETLIGGAPRLPNAYVLDMTVCCRSNDMIFGGYGANAVHFSVLQEYLAARIGVGVGRYYQLSNNFHAYVDVLEKVCPPGYRPQVDEYETPLVPLVTDPATFDDEVRTLLVWVDAGKLEVALVEQRPWTNAFIPDVALPLLHAHAMYKQGLFTLAAASALRIKAPDWERAAVEWLERRKVKREAREFARTREEMA